MSRTGGQSDWFGPRLPISDPPKPSPEPCDLDAGHVGGIRFELHRYGRKHGYIRLCATCLRDFLIVPDPDPRYVEEKIA